MPSLWSPETRTSLFSGLREGHSGARVKSAGRLDAPEGSSIGLPTNLLRLEGGEVGGQH
jgi:hypothetical protein